MMNTQSITILYSSKHNFVLMRTRSLPKEVEIRRSRLMRAGDLSCFPSCGNQWIKEQQPPYFDCCFDFFKFPLPLQALLFLASISGLCFAISLVLICVYLIRFCCCSNEDDEETKTQRVCCVTWSCVAAVIVCW